MLRTDKILSGLSRDMRFLEIGPSYNPAVPKRDGWKVWTVDHATREGLVAKYQGHTDVDVSRIEDVDFVWTGGPLDSVVPTAMQGTIDALIASHVIEHIPDLVGFFSSATKLLSPRGIVSLAVPDKRFCFDYFRPLSTTGQIVEAHRSPAMRCIPAAIFDHYAYACSIGGRITWGQTPVGTPKLIHSFTQAWDIYSKQPSAEYVDYHAWQFTPSSFELIVLELATLELIDFHIIRSFPTDGPEFYVQLQKGRGVVPSDNDLKARRVELLERIVEELGQQSDYLRARNGLANTSIVRKEPDHAVTQSMRISDQTERNCNYYIERLKRLALNIPAIRWLNSQRHRLRALLVRPSQPERTEFGPDERFGGLQRWMLFSFLLLGVVYVTAAWTPSHFAIALSQLGFNSTGLIAGSPQDIRSDEFHVATPLIRNVVENGFGTVDKISPYGEPFRAFVASPIHDWSLIVKPQFWGFLVLPPAYALSLYFFILYAAFVAGYTLLLCRFGVSHTLALLGSLILLSSQLPQVWWTQNGPIYAFAPWPLLAFLSRIPWFLRAPAIAYTTAFWLFGELYPPAIIGNIFAWAVLVLAFAREELAVRNWITRLAPAALGVGIGIAIVWFYFSDLIPIMQNTVYPGHRVSSGGGVPWLMILAHLFPNVATMGYEPIIRNSNICEIGVVGSYLPLMLLILADYRSLLPWIDRNRVGFAIWFVGLALMLAWMVFPVPSAFGIPFLWHLVPPHRLLWGFGLLLTLGSAILASRVNFRFSRARVGVFAALVCLAWLVSKTLLIDPLSPVSMVETARALELSSLDLVVLAPLATVMFLHVSRPNWIQSRLRTALMLCVLFSLVVTFGRFNPIQSAHSIFTRETTPFLEALRVLGRANPRGWAATPGGYGVLLNAFGIPAINHVLLQPNLPFFRNLYPTMPSDEFNLIFNRFAHIHLDFDKRISTPYPNVISIPIFDVGTPLPIVNLNEAPFLTASTNGQVDKIEATRLDKQRWRLVVRGWAPFAGITSQQRLAVGVTDGAVFSARAVRIIRIDVGDVLKDRAYDTAGFALELIVALRDPTDSFPVDSLMIAAIDEKGASYGLKSALSK